MPGISYTSQQYSDNPGCIKRVAGHVSQKHNRQNKAFETCTVAGIEFYHLTPRRLFKANIG